MQENAKSIRRSALKRILDSGEIGDQSHLQEKLEENGIHSTQATISRDLRDMGYVRVALGEGRVRYEALDETRGIELGRRMRILFETFVTGLCGTGNLLLVRTTPGNANGVASILDRLRRPGILGTVAGDDTILVVLVSSADRRRVEKELASLL